MEDCNYSKFEEVLFFKSDSELCFAHPSCPSCAFHPIFTTRIHCPAIWKTLIRLELCIVHSGIGFFLAVWCVYLGLILVCIYLLQRTYIIKRKYLPIRSYWYTIGLIVFPSPIFIGLTTLWKVQLLWNFVVYSCWTQKSVLFIVAMASIPFFQGRTHL